MPTATHTSDPNSLTTDIVIQPSIKEEGLAMCNGLKNGYIRENMCHLIPPFSMHSPHPTLSHSS